MDLRLRKVIAFFTYLFLSVITFCGLYNGPVEELKSGNAFVNSFENVGTLQVANICENLFQFWITRLKSLEMIHSDDVIKFSSQQFQIFTNNDHLRNPCHGQTWQYVEYQEIKINSNTMSLCWKDIQKVLQTSQNFKICWKIHFTQNLRKLFMPQVFQLIWWGLSKG